jgi:NADH-quinone oxidoreductase subunit M
MAHYAVYLLLLPLVSAILVALIGAKYSSFARSASLVSTIISLFLAGIAAVVFSAGQHTALKDPLPSTPEFRPEMVTKIPLVPMGQGAGIEFYIGIDGLNIWLVVLTALLMVSSVLVSWHAVKERVHEFYAWLLVLQTAMVGVFLSFDIVLFYVFFELTLVPLFFLIGIWGGSQRQYAARKFFVYTLAGSLITLLGVLGLVFALPQAMTDRETNRPDRDPSTDVIPQPVSFAIPQLVKSVSKLGHDLDVDVDKARLVHQRDRADAEASKRLTGAEERAAFWRKVQLWVFAAMMVGFAIKVPLFPVHTWLPLAHVEAPTAGSVLLAGVLLKIGAYGFLRLCIPLVPDASLSFGAPLIGTLAVIGILYGAWCAYAQEDIKKLVAYSSVSHLGYCMLGLFAMNEIGLTGGLLQMINHGLSTGALFLLVGMLYERYHTRKMDDYGGMGAKLKLLSVFMVFICMSSVGLPGLNGFWGEVSVLLGMYGAEALNNRPPILAILGACGMVFGALYLLTMLRRVFFGEVKEPHHDGPGPVPDLNGRELAALIPIAVVCVVLGLYPKPFLDSVRADVRAVAKAADEARQRETKHAQTLAEKQTPTQNVAVIEEKARR